MKSFSAFYIWILVGALVCSIPAFSKVEVEASAVKVEEKEKKLGEEKPGTEGPLSRMMRWAKKVKKSAEESKPGKWAKENPDTILKTGAAATGLALLAALYLSKKQTKPTVAPKPTPKPATVVPPATVPKISDGKKPGPKTNPTSEVPPATATKIPDEKKPDHKPQSHPTDEDEYEEFEEEDVAVDPTGQMTSFEFKWPKKPTSTPVDVEQLREKVGQLLEDAGLLESLAPENDTAPLPNFKGYMGANVCYANSAFCALLPDLKHFPFIKEPKTMWEVTRLADWDVHPIVKLLLVDNLTTPTAGPGNTTLHKLIKELEGGAIWIKMKKTRTKLIESGRAFKKLLETQNIKTFADKNQPIPADLTAAAKQVVDDYKTLEEESKKLVALLPHPYEGVGKAKKFNPLYLEGFRRIWLDIFQKPFDNGPQDSSEFTRMVKAALPYRNTEFLSHNEFIPPPGSSVTSSWDTKDNPDPADEIQLPVPELKEGIALQTLLDAAFDPQDAEWLPEYAIPSTKEIGASRKLRPYFYAQEDDSHLPVPILLKRFASNGKKVGNVKWKVHTPVYFNAIPLVQILVKRGDREPQKEWALITRVVLQGGDLSGGHYVEYNLQATKNAGKIDLQWVCHNDEHVNTIFLGNSLDQGHFNINDPRVQTFFQEMYLLSAKLLNAPVGDSTDLDELIAKYSPN